MAGEECAVNGCDNDVAVRVLLEDGQETITRDWCDDHRDHGPVPIESVIELGEAEA